MEISILSKIYIYIYIKYIDKHRLVDYPFFLYINYIGGTFYKSKPINYADTECINLVAFFIKSLLKWENK